MRGVGGGGALIKEAERGLILNIVFSLCCAVPWGRALYNYNVSRC